MTPLVSIVTIAYNAGPFIADAIQSVRHQTHEDLEHIIVDDGSSDDTVDIVQGLAAADARIRLIEIPHSGIPVARNVGIRESHGEYMAVLDADDLAFPERVEKQSKFLSEHPDVGMVGAWELAFDIVRNEIWLVKHPTSDEDLRRSWVHTQVFTHSAVMMRKSALDHIGGYDEMFSIGSDPDLWARMAGQYRVENLPEPLVLRRHHARQSSMIKGWRDVALRIRRKRQAIALLGLPVWRNLYLVYPALSFVPEPAKRFARAVRGKHQRGDQVRRRYQNALWVPLDKVTGSPGPRPR